MKVYLDNGATTRCDEKVIERMKKIYLKNYGNPSSLHSLGRDAKKEVDRARKEFANYLKISEEEIIFVASGSEADNLAIKGLSLAYPEKKHIITSKIEHPAILRTCEDLERNGYEITYLDVNKEGLIDIKKLKELLRTDTLVVSIMHANNEIGTINDIESISKICREKNVFFHTDAVQSLGKVKLNLGNIDLASFSAHKIHGPKGVGALYIKKGIRLKSIIKGGGQERGLRAGTENVPGIVGFAEALTSLSEKEIERITELRDYFIERVMKEIKEVHLNGPLKERLCNSASISFHYVEGEGLLYHLDAKGIAVSTGSACSSKSLQVSHVLRAIGLKHEIAHGTIRFTFSKYNTKKEIDYVIDSLKEIVTNLRKMSPLYPEEK